jgi:peptidoglycan/LPS O-acetylase OafA/YrhL
MAAATAFILFVEGASRGATAVGGSFASQPIAWLGRHSYELYLFHIIILAGMRNLLKPVNTALLRAGYFALFLALSVLVAWAIARYYSEPLNGWIRGRLTRRSEQARMTTP